MDAVVKQIQDKFGTAAIKPLDGYAPSHNAGFITTGSFSVDYVIGRPGLPLGRIVEIFGPFSSGKSTIAASCIASFQRNGGKAIIIDSEHSYSPEWTRTFGIDPKELLLMEPSDIQAMFEQVAYLCNTIADAQSTVPVLVVIDSISAFPTPEELEFLKDGSKKDPSRALGLHARYCAKGFRILSNLIWDCNVSVLCISQLKDNPMMPYQRSKLGGAAVDFHAAIQLQTSKAGKDEKSITTKLRCQKNKMASPFKETLFTIVFGEGINDNHTFVHAGIAAGLIRTKGGGWCTHVESGESFRYAEVVTKHGVEILKHYFPTLLPKAAEEASQIPTESAPPVQTSVEAITPNEV